MIKAVIFDMDGLLVNTEEVFRNISFSLADSMGCKLTMDFYVKLLGIRSDDEKRLWATYYPQFDLDKYRDAFHTEYAHLAANGAIHSKAGVFDLLNTLRKYSMPYAIATSSSLARAKQTLRIAGLHDFFKAIVTGEMVEHSKPSPDIFLAAAHLLGFPREECLVLEDSENGIKAGRAAGMLVCMVPDLIPYKSSFSPFCDYVCSNLVEVSDLIEADKNYPGQT